MWGYWSDESCPNLYGFCLDPLHVDPLYKIFSIPKKKLYFMSNLLALEKKRKVTVNNLELKINRTVVNFWKGKKKVTVNNLELSQKKGKEGSPIL